MLAKTITAHVVCSRNTKYTNVKAVGKGSCIVYVYARNGYAKKVQVKVE
ncbi:MAG: hypothetical protein HFH62_12000 [Lachnospiraceae bacterium]|nr:hypothetical protein [Lachnospiraceae bacterium]